MCTDIWRFRVQSRNGPYGTKYFRRATTVSLSHRAKGGTTGRCSQALPVRYEDSGAVGVCIQKERCCRSGAPLDKTKNLTQRNAHLQQTACGGAAQDKETLRSEAPLAAGETGSPPPLKTCAKRCGDGISSTMTWSTAG